MPPAKRPDSPDAATPGAEQQRVPIWLREAQRPARAQSLTRAQVVATAIAIADRDGIDAVSIRRVAGELQTRPMSLYSYFETKDDLIDLMADAVAGEAIIERELPADWREALRAIARHTRTVSQAHPWVVEAFGGASRIGPSSLRHLDQSLAAVSRLPVDDATRQALIRAVDTYTLGHVIAELSGAVGRGAEDAGAAAEFVRAQIGDGQHPHLAATDIAGLFHDEDPDASFERGLDWVLAGAAAALGV